MPRWWPRRRSWSGRWRGGFLDLHGATGDDAARALDSLVSAAAPQRERLAAVSASYRAADGARAVAEALAATD